MTSLPQQVESGKMSDQLENPGVIYTLLAILGLFILFTIFMEWKWIGIASFLVFGIGVIVLMSYVDSEWYNDRSYWISQSQSWTNKYNDECNDKKKQIEYWENKYKLGLMQGDLNRFNLEKKIKTEQCKADTANSLLRSSTSDLVDARLNLRGVTGQLKSLKRNEDKRVRHSAKLKKKIETRIATQEKSKKASKNWTYERPPPAGGKGW